MTLYRVASWEENGYNDSDFRESWFDDEANTLESVEVGSTRYAGLDPASEFSARLRTVRPLSEASLAVVDALRRVCVARIHRALMQAEAYDCEPQSATKGLRLTLLRNVKHKGVAYDAGLSGTVTWSGAFGSFYRNGYNKPSRHNLRVGLQLDNGAHVFVALSACKREAEALSSDALLSKAEDISWSMNVATVVGCRAWLTDNYLTPALARLKASGAVARS